MKSTWRAINKLLGRNKIKKYFKCDNETTNEPNEVANRFINCFSNIVENIRKNLEGQTKYFKSFFLPTNGPEILYL